MWQVWKFLAGMSIYFNDQFIQVLAHNVPVSGQEKATLVMFSTALFSVCSQKCGGYFIGPDDQLQR